MFRLSINTGNAAFDDDPAIEIARILHELADRLEHGRNTGAGLYDVNGNNVGRFTLTTHRKDRS